MYNGTYSSHQESILYPVTEHVLPESSEGFEKLPLFFFWPLEHNMILAVAVDTVATVVVKLQKQWINSSLVETVI